MLNHIPVFCLSMSSDCNCLYELKGDLSPVMLKEIFHESVELYGKSCKRDWMAKVVYLIQMLPTFGGRCNRYFWDIRLKILRLPNFNMLFQLVLTKFFKSELFSCLAKVGHVIKSYKAPIIAKFAYILLPQMKYVYFDISKSFLWLWSLLETD